MAADEELRQGPAQQAAEHETGGRAGDGQLHRALQVHRVAEARGVGAAGTVTTSQREGAFQETDHRVQIHCPGRSDPDRVLDHDEHGGHQEEDEEPGTALDEHPARRPNQPS
jgi:hypothetical protein